MKQSLLSITSVFLLLVSTNIFAAIIDFETLSPGNSFSNLTLSGATFSVTGQGRTGTGDSRSLMIFDSNCSRSKGSANVCTGGDTDLSTSDVPGGVDPINAGNILIISQNNDSANPNDSRRGGTIIIEFDSLVSSITATTVDVGDSDKKNTFEAYLDGSRVDFMDLLINRPQNNIQMATFNGLFDELRLVLAGSGALASVEFTPVPLPTALPLLTIGLMSLFGIGRHRV